MNSVRGAGLAASALLLVGCNGAHSAITARIAITDSSKSVHTFTLGCAPVSGTLPLARRVCADIGRHPGPMLRPAKARWTCSGGPEVPVVEVHDERRGHEASFGGMVGCAWPGGTALEIYWAASRDETASLTRLESRLHCDDDPALLALPTPRAKALACLHGA